MMKQKITPKNNKITIIFITIIFLFSMFFICSFNYSFGKDNAGLMVYIEGTNGSVNEYVKDGTHYLCVPKDISIEKLSIKCTIPIKSTSMGELSEDRMSVTNCFESRDEIVLSLENNEDIAVVVLQSELPSVCITLNSITQEKINAGSKDIKYSDNDLYITDSKGNVNVQTSEGNKIEMKGRGNSSWRYPKRPYQIKFSNKTKVLGMAKAKKWILLATDDDATLLRDNTAFSIAKNLKMSGTPDTKKVDLWIDGNYQGNYTLCQKIDTNSSSLNLGEKGMLVELDNCYFKQEESVFTSNKNNHFCLKEYNCDDEESASLFQEMGNKMRHR